MKRLVIQYSIDDVYTNHYDAYTTDESLSQAKGADSDRLSTWHFAVHFLGEAAGPHVAAALRAVSTGAWREMASFQPGKKVIVAKSAKGLNGKSMVL